jgi:hypothetical protein
MDNQEGDPFCGSFRALGCSQLLDFSHDKLVEVVGVVNDWWVGGIGVNHMTTTLVREIFAARLTLRNEIFHGLKEFG